MSNTKLAVTNHQDGVPIDPFDPSKLRLDQNFLEGLSVKKELTMIPVRNKPGQDFVRTMPNEDFRIITSTLEYEADKELYLVLPQIAPALERDIKPRLLVPAITATGNFFIWAIKVTLDGGNTSTWNTSAMAAAELATQKWIRVSSNSTAQLYDTYVAQGEIPEPTWPELTLAEILRLAFKDRLIDSLEHPVVKKLRGIL